jgi:hypothetical protein
MLIAKSKSEDDLNVNRRSNSGSWKGRFPQNNDRLLKNGTSNQALVDMVPNC